jgi:hypothetical protein
MAGPSWRPRVTPFGPAQTSTAEPSDSSHHVGVDAVPGDVPAQGRPSDDADAGFAHSTFRSHGETATSPYAPCLGTRDGLLASTATGRPRRSVRTEAAVGPLTVTPGSA